MATREQTTANLTACYDDLEALVESLGPDDWAVQSLCPEWTTRGVIEHLGGVESVLVGWVPTPDDNAPPFDRVGAFMAEAAGWTDAELADRFRAILADRRRELAAMDDATFATASMTPVGPGTYGRFMEVRVFDFWVHLRDITTPLGRSSDDGGPAAEMALDEVHNSIGYIVGKKIGLPDGMGIAIDLTGPLHRTIRAAVDGRAAKVDELADPTVTLSTDSLTFVQLACGRLDPQAVIDAGRISWAGDAEWGEKAARNLAFTM